jgi:hypothetical protein
MELLNYITTNDPTIFFIIAIPVLILLSYLYYKK